MLARLSTLLLCSAPAIGQVAPASLALVDGNAGSNIPFGMGLGRFQQIHGALQGVPMTIQVIAWRRDAASTPTPLPMWWSEFVVRMGEGEFEQATNSFTANYRSPPVEVVHRRRIVLPDWSQPATSNPAPFDFVVPLDVPYVHTGAHPLLWEVEVYDYSNAGALGAVDAFDYASMQNNFGIPIGTGCQLQLQGVASVLSDNRFQIGVAEWPYVMSSVRLYAFGFTDPNVAVPGLCAPLRVDPVVVVNAGFGANYLFYAVRSAAGRARVARAVVRADRYPSAQQQRRAAHAARRAEPRRP